MQSRLTNPSLDYTIHHNTNAENILLLDWKTGFSENRTDHDHDHSNFGGHPDTWGTFCVQHFTSEINGSGQIIEHFWFDNLATTDLISASQQQEWKIKPSVVMHFKMSKSTIKYCIGIFVVSWKTRSRAALSLKSIQLQWPSCLTAKLFGAQFNEDTLITKWQLLHLLSSPIKVTLILIYT